jgi:hypothetical protein
LAQIAGLFEVHLVAYDTISEELWLSAPARFFSPALARGFSEDRRRERALASEQYPEMLGYESLAVEWVHSTSLSRRTAVNQLWHLRILLMKKRSCTAYVEAF